MPGMSFHSPLGPITVTEEDGAIVSLAWGWLADAADTWETGLLYLARDQFRAYFDGERTAFALPLAPRGTAFQRTVWSHMLNIPYGQTESYAGMARTIGGGPRAVGMACAKNPVPILIPCHRVVGQNGDLTGYSGGDGICTKKDLLDLELGVTV